MVSSSVPGGPRATATAARVALRLGALAATGAAAYLASGHHRRIGARPDEVHAILPGDDLLPEATEVATRAISIDAPVDYVWPWVAQLGADKGGFYSYAWVENLVGCDITNADRIVERWQEPRVGDPFRLHPELSLTVAVLDPQRALVARTTEEPIEEGPGGFEMTWAFVVRPEPTGRGVRLLIRERYLPHGGPARAAVASVSVASAVMTVGTLRGIRGRAERLFHAGV